MSNNNQGHNILKFIYGLSIFLLVLSIIPSIIKIFSNLGDTSNYLNISFNRFITYCSIELLILIIILLLYLYFVTIKLDIINKIRDFYVNNKFIIGIIIGIIIWYVTYWYYGLFFILSVISILVVNYLTDGNLNNQQVSNIIKYITKLRFLGLIIPILLLILFSFGKDKLINNDNISNIIYAIISLIIWLTILGLLVYNNYYSINDFKKKLKEYYFTEDNDSENSLKIHEVLIKVLESNKENIKFILTDIIYLVEKIKGKLVLNVLSIIILVFVFFVIIILLFTNKVITYQNILAFIGYIVILSLLSFLIYHESGKIWLKGDVFLGIFILTILVNVITNLYVGYGWIESNNSSKNKELLGKNVEITSENNIKLDHLKLQYPNSTGFLEKNYVPILNSNYVSLKTIQDISLKTFIIILFFYIITYLVKDTYRKRNQLNQLATKLDNFTLLVNTCYNYGCITKLYLFNTQKKEDKALKELDQVIGDLLKKYYLNKENPENFLKLLPRITNENEKITEKIIDDIQQKIKIIDGGLNKKIYK